MTSIALAGLSARALVQAAVQEGWKAVALDVFGDADTQAVAAQWRPIGCPDALAIDGDRFVAALRGVAQRGDAGGWIAGAGFERRADLLDAGNAILPLIGNTSETVRHVRDPARFFAFLGAHGIAHPAVDVQRAPMGWLTKDPLGCGGGHIERVAEVEGQALPSGRYAQREAAGVPMSATFVADGQSAVVLGINEQIVRPLGTRPFVFHGVIGPVSVTLGVRRALDAAVQAASRSFGLRGLGSLDFLLEGENVAVLELNARPPASLSLYPSVGASGPLLAHLRACLAHELPVCADSDGVVRGIEIVYAPWHVLIGEAEATAIADLPGAQDLPNPGTQVRALEPLCSVTVCAKSVPRVRALLGQRRAALLALLEKTA